MDNIILGQFGIKTAEATRPCKVAYSLDFDQPVLCTIISDQPFFYFDEEIAEEEIDMHEDDIDGMDLDAMDAELERLKACIDLYEEAYEKTTAHISAHHESDRFYENNEAVTSCDVDSVCETMRESRTGMAYLDALKMSDIKILANADQNQCIYDAQTKTIYMGTAQSHDEAILSLSYTLRTVWQDIQGVYVDPKCYAPDEAITINRLLIADAHVSMARISWELQLAGYKSSWSLLNYGSTGDVARAIAREAHKDFRSLSNGQANTAAFEAWFLSERPRVVDDKLIRSMLGQDTKNKSDHETIDMPQFIYALGKMPFGKNYLAPHIEIIIQDGIFNEVRDRSNANFLWFIKFEQSFQETEQYLQTDHSFSDAAVTADLNATTNTESHGSETPCDIIQLFSKTNGFGITDTVKSRAATRPFSANRRGADIIDFSARL